MHQDIIKFWKYSPVKKPKYKGKFCYKPFEVIQIDGDGDVQLCTCAIHMPYTLGNIYQDTLQDIWLSEGANRVRQAVADEDFTYCSWSCDFLHTLPNRPAVLPVVQDFPKTIKLNMDLSCNLKCPSCREGIIIEKNSTKIDKQIELYNQIIQWGMDDPTKILKIIPMGSGEIFASHSGLAFLKLLKDYPYNNIKLDITTNGTLIYRNRELLTSIRHLINSFSISIDASTPETYAVVRGGDWNELLLGLEFIKNTITKNLTFRFCIQKNNYHEIESFADFTSQYNAAIVYQKLLDWGHWDIAWWHDNNVLDRSRDTFNLTLDSIQRVKLKYPKLGFAAEISKYLEQRKKSP